MTHVLKWESFPQGKTIAKLLDVYSRTEDLAKFCRINYRS